MHMKTTLPAGPLKTLHIDFSCGKPDGSNAAIIKVESKVHRGTSIHFDGPCQLVFHRDRARLKYELQTYAAVTIEKM